MASDKDSIEKSFTGTGNSDYLQVRQVAGHANGGISIWLLIQGTFTGTINIQINRMGKDTDWVTMPNGTFTAATTQTVNIPANCDIRLNASALSAGQADCFLTIN